MLSLYDVISPGNGHVILASEKEKQAPTAADMPGWSKEAEGEFDLDFESLNSLIVLPFFMATELIHMTPIL